MLEHAQLYVGFGFAVLPVHRPVHGTNGLVCSCGRPKCPSPAKHPFSSLAPRGVKDATKDLAALEMWFGSRDLNIAIATGAVSDINVLDVDPRHLGDESLAKLERLHGVLPPTWRFLTGGGGEHILFRHPGGRIPNSTGKIGPGVDVRGDGGYVVAPPSQHICGKRYAISVDHHPDEVPLAAVPGWLLDLLHPPATKEKAGANRISEWRQLVGSCAAEGERNQTIASIAGHLLRNRIDPWVTVHLLRAWNRTWCNPPLVTRRWWHGAQHCDGARSIGGSEATMDDPLVHLAVLNRQGAPSVHQNMLGIGSDIEIAGRVKKDVGRAYGEVIHVEGQFWRYCGTHCEVIPST